MKTPNEWWDIMPDGTSKKRDLQVIEEIQKDAYNQCLYDLIEEQVLLNYKRTLLKFKK